MRKSLIVGIVSLLLGVVIFNGCQQARERLTETTESKAQQRKQAPEKEEKKLDVIDSGFTQGEHGVSVGAIVKNPNPNYAAISVDYKITLYDANNRVVASLGGVKALIFPDAETGIGNPVSLTDQSTTVARMDFQIRPGRWEKREKWTPLGFEGVSYIPHEVLMPKVTGTITSSYKKDLTNVRVTTVFLDSNGKVIGGDSTFVSFVPAEGKTGFEVNDPIGVSASNVKYYGEITSLTLSELQSRPK